MAEPDRDLGDLWEVETPHRAEQAPPEGIVATFRRLDIEQRVAGVGALLLVVSTFGPFSFVEAAMVLTALGILFLLRQRAHRKLFHLPFGDGAVVLAAGLWSALLILTRIFDRPLGQSILALGCSALIAAAGLRERSRRPADDVPERSPAPRRPRRGRRARSAQADTIRLAGEDATERLPADEPVQLSLDEPDDPPEYRPPR